MELSFDREELDTREAVFSKHVVTVLRCLRTQYNKCLEQGDYEGVYQVSRQCEIVQRAAGAYSSSHLIVTASLNTRHGHPGIEDLGTVKMFLVTIQERMSEALLDYDYEALSRAAEASNNAVENLAHPDIAFGGIQSDNTAEVSHADIEMIRNMSALNSITPDAFRGTTKGVNDPKKKGFGKIGSLVHHLSFSERVVVVLYGLMCLGALIAVIWITRSFISGTVHPGSFLGVKIHRALPMPVITVCLARPGIPHSRLQVFNFKDAQGRNYREGDLGQTYQAHLYNGSDGVIERFWENPKTENCTETVGDFFPFSPGRLSSLANRSTTTSCKPCYRFGRNNLTLSESTEPENSSLISVLTDHYAMECFQRPGGLTFNSKDYLHDLAYNNVQSDNPTLVNFNILDRSDGANMKETMTDDDYFERLTGKQLCNLYYFALFPKLVGRLHLNDTQIRYSFNGSTWFFNGTGQEFEPPARGSFESDMVPLESIEMYISHNSSVKTDTIRGEADVVHVGPNSQNFVSLRNVKVYSEPQFDVQSSSSNFVATDVIEKFGFWLNCRIFYNYNRLITENYYRKTTYEFGQYLVDFFGYLGMFTGASVFSVLLLPVLHSIRSRQKARMKNERPEAYLLRKFKKQVAARAVPEDDLKDDPIQTLKLPGYNV